MAKQEEGYNQSDTGNWNMASDYSKRKIAHPLFLVDQYAEIAKFGSADIVEDLDNYVNLVSLDILKLKGFERLINKLILVIDNSLFAIKIKDDIKLLNNYKKALVRIENLIPYLQEYNFSQRTNSKQIHIIQDRYDKVLKIVLDIKYKINKPLNRSHLIFVDREEFDPKKYKNKIIEDAITRG